MSGSHLFNLGLYQKHFLSTSKVTGPAINMGCTRGRGSTSRMFYYCNKRSSIPSLCINQFITLNQPSSSSCSFLSYVIGRGPGSGILNTNFGWDNDGVWFSGDAGNPAPSYPIFTNCIIPSNKPVDVSVDFVYNYICADFGLCFYSEETIPEWQWAPNNTRIACQYDCATPYVVGLNNVLGTTYRLSFPNVYTCNVIYNPNTNPNITMNTKLNGTIIDTISLDNQTLNCNYRIGFSADNDTLKTYIKNLKININNGEKIYNNNLQNVTIPPF